MLTDPSIRLRNAIIEGNLLIVKRLLRRFPELLTNIDSSNGWSSLHYASYHGRYLICVLLIKMGHDRHEILTTFEHDTCVHLALMNGHEQTTHLLLQHFPQFINHKGNMGRTPAHIACMHDYHQVLSLLIGVGAMFLLPDDNGDTPLHVCLEYGNINCMRLLVLEVEATDDQVKNKDNWRPSDVSITFEMRKTFRVLLKEAKINGVAKKSSFQSFRTPVLTSKPAFDDGPSPILSMNSPTISLFSQSNTLPPFPRISISRKPSNVNTPMSPIVRNTSFTSILASVDTSVNSAHMPTNKKEYPLISPLERHSIEISSNISPRRNTVNRSREESINEEKSSKNLLRSNSNSNLFSRYLSPKNNDENENPLIINKDNTAKSMLGTSDSVSSSYTDDNIAMPRRKISLLNIPVSKLRHNNHSNSNLEK